MGIIGVRFGDGNHRSAVRTHSRLFASAAGKRFSEQSASPQRNSLRRRAWLQVARLAQTFRQLAYDLHPYVNGDADALNATDDVHIRSFQPLITCSRPRSAASQLLPRAIALRRRDARLDERNAPKPVMHARKDHLGR